MPMYNLYNPDGSIYSSNQIYDDPKKYEDQMHRMGLTEYVKVDGVGGLLQPDVWYVDVKTKEIVERPDMPVTLTKDVIKCGDSDSAIFRGMPKDSYVTVFWKEQVVYPQFKLDAEELELSIPVPATYLVEIRRWPYKTYLKEVRAEA